MKNNIYILFLLLLSCFVVGCEEELEEFTGPYRLIIGGPSAGDAGSTLTYTLGEVVNPESYTWSIVEGPGEIVGTATGNTVDVRLTAPGEVELEVTNNAGDFRTLNITSNKVAPTVTVQLDTTATGDVRVLRSGDEATVLFSFATPLAVDPTLSMLADETAFSSGELSNLTKVNETTYSATYTAGEGDGTPEAIISNLIATSTFGSDTIAADTLSLYRIDNIAPIADLSYSQDRASEGSVVTITATFSEEVMPLDPEDDFLYVNLERDGMEAQRDTLWATDDPLVYTTEYTVEGEGNGPVTVSLENVGDFASNPLAATTNQSGLEVDNTAPEILISSVTDEGDYATIRISSSEAGTGLFLILEEGEEAPESAEAFMSAEGAASGSMNLRAGFPGTANSILGEGNYVVYLLVQDEAGNFSVIESSELTMD